MRRTGKRSESPYNEANTTGPAVQGVYNYLDLGSGLMIDNGLFLPREGGVAVDAYNAPTLTQATLASSFTAQSYPSLPMYVRHGAAKELE